jgi:AcrR family transcriptional regulator
MLASVTPPPAAGPRRRTQAERTAQTRSKLLEATIESLAARGYAGTTTLAVCERAGVSHGSLLHHFGRREALMGAALEAVHGRLRERVVAGLEALPQGEARVEALVELMWSAFGAPEFKAVLELWLAAANQPELSWAVWPEARAFDAGTPALARQLFPEVAERLPDFDDYVSLVFQALQGMGLVHATLPPREDGAETRRRVRALLTRVLRDAFSTGSSATRDRSR